MEKAYLSLNQTEAAVLGAASRIFVHKMSSAHDTETLNELDIMRDSIRLALEMALEIEHTVVADGETGM